jgi:peptidyl-prolyl cis-trans isomerase C
VRVPATTILLAVSAWAASTISCRCERSRDGKPAAPLSVAIVNGEPIATEDFRRELAHSRDEDGEGEAPIDLLRKRILEDMIDRTLLLQQARARSVAVGQDQVERAFLRLRSEYPGTHFDDLLAQERLSAAELKTRLKEQLTVEKLFNDEVFPRVQVTEDEMQRYYREHPDEFDQPERVRVLQVVVKTREEAQKIREELRRRPQGFAEVARRASIAPEGKNGGDLGYFGKGSGMPEVFEICFNLGLNTLSEVTPSPYGFHIFKVVDRKPAAKRPFEQARGEIAAKLLRERRSGAQEEYLAALRARAKVKIDKAAVAAVTP